MSDHALAEGLAGLASRVENLVHLTEGDDSRTLQQQEDRLAKLALVVIAEEMDATNSAYKNAVGQVKAAIDTIGAADRKIQNVAKVIRLVAKALDTAEKVAEKAAGV